VYCRNNTWGIGRLLVTMRNQRALRLAQALRMCKLYVSFTGRRVSASIPAAGGAAHAFGGSEDGRASLYGDGLVRLGMDGPAAHGEHPLSYSRLDASLIWRGGTHAKPHSGYTFAQPTPQEGGQEIGEAGKVRSEVCEEKFPSCQSRKSVQEGRSPLGPGRPEVGWAQERAQVVLPQTGQVGRGQASALIPAIPWYPREPVPPRS
jgi:hypothetical protein